MIKLIRRLQYLNNINKGGEEEVLQRAYKSILYYRNMIYIYRPIIITINYLSIIKLK